MGGAGGPRDRLMDAAAVAAVRTALMPVAPRARVVLAVSGGGDSTGMAHLVMAGRPDLDASVIHVRHGLRDDSADADAAARHADALGLRFDAVAVTVPRDGTGPENAARSARIAALVTAAREAGAPFVLLGHTADDQAETVLLNVARGTGLRGLAGMPPVRTLADGVRLVRPVLELRRSVVRAVAEGTGLPVAQDPTNDDPQQRRSRARHDLLPLLADLTGGGSDAVTSLARLARHAAADNAALDALADEALRAMASSWGPVVTAPADALDALPSAVARRVVRGLVGMAAPGTRPPASATEALLQLRDGQAAALHGGMVASRGGGLLAVRPAADPLPARPVETMVDLPELGVMLQRCRNNDRGLLPPWAPASAATSVAVSDAPAVVRARRPGDRIRTRSGSQSVADAMIDAGVPRVARDLVPVVEDERGLLWVPGVAVRADADGAWRLRLELLAGQ